MVQYPFRFSIHLYRILSTSLALPLWGSLFLLSLFISEIPRAGPKLRLSKLDTLSKLSSVGERTRRHRRAHSFIFGQQRRRILTFSRQKSWQILEMSRKTSIDPALISCFFSGERRYYSSSAARVSRQIHVLIMNSRIGHENSVRKIDVLGVHQRCTRCTYHLCTRIIAFVCVRGNYTALPHSGKLSGSWEIRRCYQNDGVLRAWCITCTHHIQHT